MRDGVAPALAGALAKAADHGRSVGLLGQADASRATATTGAPATTTAELSYPVRVKEVTVAQAAPKATPAAQAARAATRKAPTSGRRR